MGGWTNLRSPTAPYGLSTRLARLQALRAAVQAGVDDIEAGRYRDFGSFEEMEKHLISRSGAALESRKN